MASSHALHLGYRCTDYVVTRLVWRRELGSHSVFVWCSAY